MKAPNLDLFDSKAKHRSVGVLASPLDNYPTIERPKEIQQVAKTEPLIASERSNVRTNERSDERTNVRKPRQIIRHTFDIYQDQLVALKALQFKAVQVGNNKVTLGDMVQEAIDLWLKQK